MEARLGDVPIESFFVTFNHWHCGVAAQFHQDHALDELL